MVQEGNVHDVDADDNDRWYIARTSPQVYIVELTLTSFIQV